MEPVGISEHPHKGTLVICNFDGGFVEPEMVKPRPVIIISPKIVARPRLCTVVPLSTTPPDKEMPYHCEIKLPFLVPPPFDSETHWIKGDMINSVSFDRVNLVRLGKDKNGKRRYLLDTVGDEILAKVLKCTLHGVGLSQLTKHL